MSKNGAGGNVKCEGEKERQLAFFTHDFFKKSLVNIKGNMGAWNFFRTQPSFHLPKKSLKGEMVKYTFTALIWDVKKRCEVCQFEN